MNLFSLCLAAIVTCCCTLSCSAEPTRINKASQLRGLFSPPTPGGISPEIELTDDIDFENQLELPLGAYTNSEICTAFKGKLNGNGHRIKGIAMVVSSEQPFSNSGLFCCLNNATIENLIIDKNCSFSGVITGGLSVDVTGSLTIRNVTSGATSKGEHQVSGFIGRIENLKEGDTVVFEDCVFEGAIETNAVDVGGFVGCILTSVYTNISFSNCINFASISGFKSIGGFIGGLWKVHDSIISIINGWNRNTIQSHQDGSNTGGFIGNIPENRNLTLSLFNCRNDGTIIGGNIIGGLIGTYNWNNYSIVTIHNCTNNGHIKGSFTVGGLVGMMEEILGCDLLINCSSNTETVEGSDFTSGLVGRLSAEHSTSFINLTMKNSVNKGQVDSSGVTCGLFCVNQAEKNRAEVNLMNSINKGGVKGNNAYGISTNVHTAFNVVSVGTVTGTTSTCPFWEKRQTSRSLYAGRNNVVNCASGEYQCVIWDPYLNAFTLVGGDDVHVNLNNEAIKNKFGMGWTNQLNFSVLQLGIGNPVNLTVPVIPDDTLSHVFQDLDIAISDCITVNKSDNAILEPSTTLQYNTDVILCHEVNYSGFANGSTIMEHGDILENVKELDEFFTKDYLLTNLTDSALVYNKSDRVFRDMSILITAVKRTELVIDFGNETEANDTTIRDAIIDVIIANGDTPAQITVIEEDDGIFRVVLVLPEEETETVTDKLLSCSSKQS